MNKCGVMKPFWSITFDLIEIEIRSVNSSPKMEVKPKRKRGLLISTLKILLVACIVTLLLMLAANTHGIGYEGSVEIISREVIVPNHPCFGVAYTSNVKVHYKPFLFLITCINGKESMCLVNCRYVYYPPEGDPYYTPPLNELKDNIIGNIVWTEIARNLPYLFSIGLIVAILMLASLRTVKARFFKSLKGKTEIKVGDGWTS